MSKFKGFVYGGPVPGSAGFYFGADGNNNATFPANLFSVPGSDGTLIEPYATSSMFQDAAGTTAAVEGDPVGLAFDQSGLTNDLAQSVNDDYRPIYGRYPKSGARQLLDGSDDFTGPEWAAGDATASLSAIPAPDGSLTAYNIQSVGGASDYLARSTVVQNGQVKSIYARTVSGTGTVGLLSYHTVPGAVQFLTEDWQKFDVPSDADETGGVNFYAVDFRSSTMTEIVVWHPQLEAGSTATDYQFRVDQYDITEVGQPDVWYLQMDGVDDYMIATYGADLGQPVTAIAVVSFDDSGDAAYIYDGISAGNRMALNRDLDQSIRSFAGLGIGGSIVSDTAVVTTVFNGASSTMSLNGVLDVSGDVGPQTPGGVIVGSQYGLANFLNGKIYALMIINRVLTDAEISQVENYFASKAGVTL